MTVCIMGSGSTVMACCSVLELEKEVGPMAGGPRGNPVLWDSEIEAGQLK